AIFREMAPHVAGLLLSTRVGARIAAELAGMSYTSQLDALRALGRSPGRVLFLPFVTGALIAFPVSILAGAIAGVGAAALFAGLPSAGLSIGTRRFADLAGDSFAAVLIVSLVIKALTMATTVV